MIRKILTQSAKNMPLGMVKNSEVGNKTSSITGLVKKLSASINIDDNTELLKVMMIIIIK